MLTYHSGTPCTKQIPSPNINNAEQTQERSPEEETELFRLRTTQLKQLASSPSLRLMLEDSRLRTVLTEIALSPVPGELLKEAITQPEFAAFTNEVLVAVGALEGGQFVL